MSKKPKIYDSESSLNNSLENLLSSYRELGVGRVIFKVLSSNDNSKNQVYIAGHFTDIGFFPTDNLVSTPSNSKKITDSKRKIKFTADLNFSWLAPDGQAYPAPTAKLIYYPQFPEVRLSGFLQGSPIDMGGWMDPSKQGRSEGRVLFFGIRGDGAIFSYLAVSGSRIATEVGERKCYALSSVLCELPYTNLRAIEEQSELFVYETSERYRRDGDSRELLISELRRIHLAGSIPSKKLSSDGSEKSYTANNGGGYTLEAELGVVPNGIAEPDFHGWEVKQFGVPNFDKINSKALTLMTPEPDGGVYRLQGVKDFIRSYGYRNQNIPDRYDFTGRHFSNSICDKSGLTLVTPGFDCESRLMVDGSGYIGLLDRDDNIAASWSYAKLMNHWKKKHARAAYIPSIVSTLLNGERAYHYGNSVRLYEGTDINRLLRAVSDKHVYYDPGIKMEHALTIERVKKRSQFRIKSSNLSALYENLDVVDVMGED